MSVEIARHEATCVTTGTTAVAVGIPPDEIMVIVETTIVIAHGVEFREMRRREVVITGCKTGEFVEILVIVILQST